MKWNVEQLINADIEKVYSVVDLNNEEARKIVMPNVLSHEKINEEGTLYKQKYKEGKKTVEYIVEIKELIERDDMKSIKFCFNMSNIFDVTGTYQLVKKGEKTLFTYSGEVNPLKWYYKILSVLMGNSDKEAKKYVLAVQKLAEKIS